VTELSVLERVRAAVAEAGYDPSLIWDGDDEDPFTWPACPELPSMVVWRAREAVVVCEPICRRCWVTNAKGGDPPPCLAVRRFVEDCGRDRTDP
jgi:hypothetical protein